MNSNLRKPGLVTSAALALSLLAGCGGDDAATTAPAPVPEPEKARFEITLINATAGQPMSPPVVVAHGAGYQLFTIGQPASTGLERLAEGAQTDTLIEQAVANAVVRQAIVGSAAPLPPGGSATTMIEVEAADVADLRLSLATMLVNTNDAIAAVNGQSLSAMDAGQSIQLSLLSYDTGTEANTEAAATMPGPAANGAGFDPVRDDLGDRVSVHPGAVTGADGLSGSALSGVHRWDHPAAFVRIRRIN